MVVGHTETREKAGHPSLGPEPARLTERHFVDVIPEENIRNVLSVLKIEQMDTKVHALEPGVVSVVLHSVL